MTTADDVGRNAVFVCGWLGVPIPMSLSDCTSARVLKRASQSMMARAEVGGTTQRF